MDPQLLTELLNTDDYNRYLHLFLEINPFHSKLLQRAKKDGDFRKFLVFVNFRQLSYDIPGSNYGSSDDEAASQ